MTAATDYLNTRLSLAEMARDAASHTDRTARDVEAVSLPKVSVGDRFAECARLAAETTPEESRALQDKWLKERG